VYETEEECRAYLVPFLRKGLERGEKVLSIVDTHTAEAVLGYLRDEGLAAEPYLARGQLSILTAAEAYARASMEDGIFVPEKVIAFLQGQTERALAEGYAALCVSAEMTWILHGLCGSERIIEHEGKLNAFFPDSKCVGLCQYDRRRFDPSVLLDVLVTHPMVVVGTEVYRNFYYMRPPDVLGHDRQRAALHYWLESVVVHEETARRSREAEILAELARTINASLNLDTILPRVAEDAKELCGSEIAAIALRGPKSGRMTLRYLVGAPCQADRTIRIEPGKGIGGQVLATGRPFRTENYAEDPRINQEYLEVVREGGVVAAMVLPIPIGDVVEGLLYVADRSPRPFTDRDEAILLRLADLAAVAIRNAQLFEKSERRRKAAGSLADLGRLISQSLDPREVEQRIVESLRTLLEAESSALFGLEPDSEDLVLLAASGDIGLGLDGSPVFPHGIGVATLAVRERQPVITPDVLADPRITLAPEVRARLEQSSTRAVLAVPLIVRETLVIGALEVGARKGRELDEEQMRLALAFADQAAFALENAQLYKEAIRRGQEAEELARAARLLTESLNVSEVGERIVEAVGSLFGAQASNLRLLQPDGSSVSIAAGGLARDQLRPGHVLPPGVGLAGRVAIDRGPVWSPDLLSDSRLVYEDDMGGYLIGSGIRSALAVPLRVKGEITGALIIGDQGVRAFSKAEVSLLQAFADQAAIALENSRLYEELRASLQEVEAAQEQIIQSERLRALGELAGGVAHDFNNTLAVILGRVQLLLLQTRNPELQRQLTIVEKAARDGAQTVRRIQEFTRRTPARAFKLVDLNQVVEDVVEVTRSRWKDEAQAKGIQYELRVKSAPLPPVAGDPAELREALTTVVFNALDAMPKGGRVTFTTGVEGERVYCVVADTGIGMADEVRHRAFEPFFTTKVEKGSGLGLSVAYGIVTRHGGEIEVQSRVGQGSAFTIRLPRGQGIVEAPGRLSPSQCAHRAKILVIDDEPEVREVLAEVLTSQGHTVVACADGPSGLTRAQEERFDLVITDLGMPGMSGWEVARRVKARSPGTPVVLITGWGDRIKPEEARGKGVEFLVAKPFEREDITAVVNQAVTRVLSEVEERSMPKSKGRRQRARKSSPKPAYRLPR